ncbi:PAS domain S-box protein [Polaribacter sp. P097]|uniref:PAS domain S-box protein n=1 Tax=Polaribacter sp. P097 TaxID=3117398 RepID=UPI002FE1B480
MKTENETVADEKIILGSKIESLEKELADTRAQLQLTNEDLKLFKEELFNKNEELQEVNKRFEIVNGKYQSRLDKVERLNTDLDNLMNSTKLGTIFLDLDFKIRRFSPTIKEFFSITENDIGKPIENYNSFLGEDDNEQLQDRIQKVIIDGVILEKEIEINNKWYIKRKTPYFNVLKQIEGCVISFIDITSQKVLENRLTENVKFLNNVNSVIPVALYIYNQHTSANEYANGVLERIIGYSPKEVQEMGENFLSSVFHPEDLPKLNPYLDQINNSKEGVVHELEYRMKHKKGHYVWLLARDTIYDRVPNTDKVRHIGIAMDITNIKQSEEELKEANLTYNTVVEASMAGYWDWDLKNEIFFMSPTFKKMFGYEENEAPNTYEWVTSVMHPEDFPIALKSLNKHIESRGKMPYNNDIRYFHKDGSIIWVNCIGNVIDWDEDGNPQRMTGCHIDITSLKKSEKQLKNSNQKLEVKVKERTIELEKALDKFHNLYNYAPDMFLSVSAKTANIIECNNTFLVKFGYKKQDIIGHKVFNFISEEFIDKAKETFKSFKKYGFVKEFSLRMKCKDGNPLDVVLNASAMRDENGEIINSYSSLRDVTQLNRVVKDLEELTYVTSHDLKAPISNISSYVSLLKEDDTITDSISKEAINWIDQNVDNAERTLKNLVSVTKARTLVLENITTINLEESTKEILVVLSSSIENSGAKITYDFNKCKTIDFSKAHLISMLQNVIENAIKYRHTDRTPEIHIQSCIDNDSFYCICISDNGIGIDLDEHKDQVFGLFRRANADVKGSGLALYIIRKVLEKSGGKIEVDSILGEGSTFKLYFKK